MTNVEMRSLRQSGSTLRGIAKESTARGRSISHQGVSLICKGISIPEKIKPTKVCLSCGEVFYPKNKKQKYCSKNCSKLHLVTPTSPYSRYGKVFLTCAKCNKFFIRPRYQCAIAERNNCKQVFCSHKCFCAQKSRVEMVELKCHRCGKMFRRSKSRITTAKRDGCSKTYCTVECYRSG